MSNTFFSFKLLKFINSAYFQRLAPIDTIIDTIMDAIMDAIMDMPMENILAEITLSDRIKDALLGKDAQFQQLHDLLKSFERGQWNHKRFQADEDGNLISKLPGFYLDTVKMADAFF